MSQTVSCLTLDDGKEYVVLEKMDIDNHSYLILFQSDNPKSVCVAEFFEGVDAYVELLTDKTLIEEILKEFFVRHPQFKM